MVYNTHVLPLILQAIKGTDVFFYRSYERMSKMSTLDRITQTLETLGITRRYRGHAIAAEAIYRILKDENGLLCLHTQVYEPLCRESQQSWYVLERNLRTVIQRAWTINRDLLREMCLYPLTLMPTVSEFLEIVAEYLQRQSRQEDQP